MIIIGYIVTAIGVILLLGNVFHFFPTFPLAGALTIAVGGLITRKGRR